MEFGARHFKEIKWKVLRKSMRRKKSGSSGVSYLKTQNNRVEHMYIEK